MNHEFRFVIPAELAKLNLNDKDRKLHMCTGQYPWKSNEHVNDFIQKKWYDMTRCVQSGEIGLYTIKGFTFIFRHEDYNWQ